MNIKFTNLLKNDVIIKVKSYDIRIRILLLISYQYNSTYMSKTIYEEYLNIIFELIAKLEWVKFRNSNGHCGGLGNLKISGVDLQLLENYEEYFNIIFVNLSKIGWAKFRTLNGNRGGLGDLKISGVDLQIVAKNYKEYYDTTFEFIAKFWWAI